MLVKKRLAMMAKMLVVLIFGKMMGWDKEHNRDDTT